MEKLGFLVIALVRNQKMDKFIDDFHQIPSYPLKREHSIILIFDFNTLLS